MGVSLPAPDEFGRRSTTADGGGGGGGSGSDESSCRSTADSGGRVSPNTVTAGTLATLRLVERCLALIAGYLLIPPAALLWNAEDEQLYHTGTEGGGSLGKGTVARSGNAGESDVDVDAGTGSSADGKVASSRGGGGRIGARSAAVASVAAATKRLRHTKVGGAAVAAGVSAKKMAVGSLARAAAAAG